MNKNQIETVKKEAARLFNVSEAQVEIRDTSKAFGRGNKTLSVWVKLGNDNELKELFI